MLDIDFTLLVQLVTFLVLLVILNAFLFQPVLRILDRREKVLGDSRELRDKFEKLGGESLDRYERKILAAKQEGMAVRARARQEALHELRDRISEAKEANVRELEKSRVALADELKASRTEMKGTLATLSREVAGKLLGRPAGRAGGGKA